MDTIARKQIICSSGGTVVAHASSASRIALLLALMLMQSCASVREHRASPSSRGLKLLSYPETMDLKTEGYVVIQLPSTPEGLVIKDVFVSFRMGKMVRGPGAYIQTHAVETQDICLKGHEGERQLVVGFFPPALGSIEVEVDIRLEDCRGSPERENASDDEHEAIRFTVEVQKAPTVSQDPAHALALAFEPEPSALGAERYDNVWLCGDPREASLAQKVSEAAGTSAVMCRWRWDDGQFECYGSGPGITVFGLIRSHNPGPLGFCR